MNKTKQKKTNWFLLALLATFLAAPNGTVVKMAGDVNPYLFNALRFGVIAVVTLPLLIKHGHNFTKTNLRNALLGGLAMVGASFGFILAIQHSQASYVAIVSLLIPIFFLLFSAKMTGEKISSRAMAGVTLAAIGAMVVVILPIAFHQSGDFIFYPLGTLFALVECICFPLALIFYKKANEDGLPMSVIMNISALMVLVSGLCVFLATSSGGVHLNGVALFGILYSGLVVLLIARSLNVVTYEHIGSAIVGALDYLENLLAILLPIIVLHEKLSVYMVVGGILILIGVYLAEHHKTAHHKHHHILRG